MEIDHIDRNVKNNSIGNIVFCQRKNQYKSEVLNDMAQRGKLSKELAIQIRQDFKKWAGRKVKFYEKKAKELNCCKRSIQNIILNKSFKEVS
ncbi:hypothetical protein [Bacillus sp. JJ722]|uniref:hypothetical protein n=1 Tax=Bacillus sp. JJ722 TaxID=3122973 RepID=UPI003000A4B8